MSTERLFQYSAAKSTEVMHSMPRFGYTDQFSALFSSTQETQDYVKGLIFAGCFIAATFIAWGMVLLVFKCLGKDRVGFLSGAAFTTSGSRPFYIRIAFVNATILFIVFTILVVTQGITNLHSAVSTVGDTNLEVQSILTDASGILNSLKSIGQSSLEVRDELTNNLGNFCPAEPNTEALTGIDFDALASEAIVLLNELDNFIENDVEYIREQIDMARDTSNLVSNTVDSIEANDWQSLVILIPYLLLATILLVAVGMAWFNKSGPIFACVLSWGILPLFVCATIAAFSLSAFVCFTAVANADACSGGAAKTPDATVYAVLDAQGLDKQELYYRAIRYYVEQCTVDDDPFQVIRDYQAQIETARTTVENLSTSLESVTVARLNLICGKDFGPFEGLLSTMKNNLRILSDDAKDTLSLLSCERVVPLYVNSVYGAACSFSINSVTWTWCAFLVIATMGMVMIMFRAAYLPNNTGAFDKRDFDLDSFEDEQGVEVEKSYLPQMTFPSSGHTSPDEGYDDDDAQSMSDLSSVYIYGDNYQVSFDESSLVSR